MALSPNIPKGTPGKLLLGFSLLALLAAAAAIEDWGQRDQLEEFDFPTGLQDDEVFPSIPDGFPLDKELVKIDGVSYYSVRRQPVSRYDDVMLRDFLDDSGRWFVYRPGKEILLGREPTEASGELYLKTANGMYLEISPEPTEAPEATSAAP